MKLYISADIEGCTGVTSFSQCSGPRDEVYDWGFARKMMTHDVNAAIRGARAAGVTEVVVRDGHGRGKNLLVGELEPGTRLISGSGAGQDGMMEGIDPTFDAVVLVGYDAQAGAALGMMDHALVGGLYRFWINGREAGEIAASAAVAGDLGVPLVAVSSDRAGCDEATAWIPNLPVACTKVGLAHSTGLEYSISDCRAAIEAAVQTGVERRQEIPPLVIPGPVTLRMEFRTVEEADGVSVFADSQGRRHGSSPHAPVGIVRLSGTMVEFTRPTFTAVHTLAYALFSLSIQARSAGS